MPADRPNEKLRKAGNALLAVERVRRSSLTGSRSGPALERRGSISKTVLDPALDHELLEDWQLDEKTQEVNFLQEELATLRESVEVNEAEKIQKAHELRLERLEEIIGPEFRRFVAEEVIASSDTGAAADQLKQTKVEKESEAPEPSDKKPDKPTVHGLSFTNGKDSKDSHSSIQLPAPRHTSPPKSARSPSSFKGGRGAATMSAKRLPSEKALERKPSEQKKEITLQADVDNPYNFHKYTYSSQTKLGSGRGLQSARGGRGGARKM